MPLDTRPGHLAGLASAAVLLWRGAREIGRPLAPVNAPSHWFWGQRAIRADGASWRYTAIGVLTHQLSALFWGVFYDRLQRRHARPSATHAVADAAVVTAVAACVDLALVPERLTPGFEQRLSRSGLTWVYVAFGAGLALGGVAALRR